MKSITIKVELTTQEIGSMLMALNDRAMKHPDLGTVLKKIEFKLFRAEQVALK